MNFVNRRNNNNHLQDLFRVLDTVVQARTDGVEGLMAVRLDISGPSIAMPRPRFVLRPFPRIYQPMRQERNQLARKVIEALEVVGYNDFPLAGTGSKLKLNAEFGTSNFNKDLDNQLKFLQDALQGIIFENDRWITKLEAEKIDVARRADEYIRFTVSIYRPTIEID